VSEGTGVGGGHRCRRVQVSQVDTGVGGYTDLHTYIFLRTFIAHGGGLAQHNVNVFFYSQLRAPRVIGVLSNNHLLNSWGPEQRLIRREGTTVRGHEMKTQKSSNRRQE